MHSFQVGIGPSRGKLAEAYLQGRVDKACLTQVVEPITPNLSGRIKKISYMAKMQAPYAVMLRGPQ
jgi:hypothetical protein